jgi:serine/threonine protein phosphatase PrpC
MDLIVLYLWAAIVVLLSALIGLGITFQRLKNQSSLRLHVGFAKPIASEWSNKTPNPSGPSLNSIPDFASTVFHCPVVIGEVSSQSFAVASSRGTSHIQLGVSREDSYSVFANNHFVAMVVCDGVSGALESHIGSSFAAQSFERFFKEEFPDGPSIEVERWHNLNRKISQGLVGLYRSRASRTGGSLPAELGDLRMAAGGAFATTLEVLICEKQTQSNPRPKLFFARLAGDGSLFEVSPEGVTRLFPRGDASGLDKNPQVSALPVFDGAPIVFSKELEVGKSLVLTTDGVGDHLIGCEAWQDRLRNLCQSSTISHSDLLDFLQTDCPEARDDRTLAIARLMR